MAISPIEFAGLWHLLDTQVLILVKIPHVRQGPAVWEKPLATVVCIDIDQPF